MTTGKLTFENLLIDTHKMYYLQKQFCLASCVGNAAGNARHPGSYLDMIKITKYLSG